MTVAVLLILSTIVDIWNILTMLEKKIKKKSLYKLYNKIQKKIFGEPAHSQANSERRLDFCKNKSRSF